MEIMEKNFSKIKKLINYLMMIFVIVEPWNNGIDVGDYPGSGKLVNEV